MQVRHWLAAATVLALTLSTVPVAPAAPPQGPDVVEGFTINTLTGVEAPTAINFGPGDGDGPDLYAALLTGDVVRFELAWTAAGPLVTGRSTFATGFNLPLGIAFGPHGAAYVSDSYQSPDASRTVGVVYRVDDGGRTAVLDKLPNGRHNTNHLRFGPDGRLHVTNGNPNDDGVEGGPADVLPYSGAILSVNASFVAEHPQTLQWRDGSGSRIPPGEIADHPVNDDFAGNVTVVAHGFRNVFGVAFGPDEKPWTAMNGADEPSSQDGLYRIDRGANYSFPFCYNTGRPGATGDDVTKTNNPQFPGATCGDEPPADALMGWHVCTTGLDFPRLGRHAFPPGFRRSVYVGECAVFFGGDWLQRLAEDPARAQHSTSHKVARVELNATGEPAEVRDFVDGLALPTDVRFGPQGAMYIADAEAIHRVAPTPRPTVEVKAVGTQFTPQTVTVPVGTTVEWEAVTLSHTVTTAASGADAFAGDHDGAPGDGDPDTFDAPLPQGATFEHTFTEPGVYWYFCRPHHGLGMIGKVVVV